MNRKEAEDFVYKSYLKAQKYQEYGAKDSKKRRNDLTFDLIRKRSNTPCVVVTGSKGKGSVSNMISQILQTEFTVGLMTSPHIVDFCERFRVNGGKISDEEFVKQMLSIQEEIEAIDAVIPKNVCISPMGIQAYLALNYFESQGTQFNIFECGKGAKFDDVNNIKHDYAVINSIFLEHTRELGDTIEEIAMDKAHVITKGENSVGKDVFGKSGEQKCVYVAEQIPSVLKVIQDRAEKFGVPLKIYGRDFWAENICYTKAGMRFDVVIGEDVYSDISIPLLGEHQAKNCALALAVCRDVLEDFCVLKRKDVLGKSDLLEKNILEEYSFPDKKDKLESLNLVRKKKEIKNLNISKMKKSLAKLTWPGRMEVISEEPFMLLDACINGASCENVIKVLKHLKIEEVTLIVGIPDDKDYAGVVRAMKDMASNIILTKSQNPHYVFTRRQQERLEQDRIKTQWVESVSEALQKAKEKDKPIVILGTTSVIAEIKKSCG